MGDQANSAQDWIVEQRSKSPRNGTRAVRVIGLMCCVFLFCQAPADDVVAGEKVAASGKKAVARLTLVRSSDKSIQSEFRLTTYGVAIAPDNKHVLAGGDGASPIMIYWNLETGQNVRWFDTFDDQFPPLFTAINPGGKIGAASTPANRLILLDLDTSSTRKPIEWATLITSLRFSPDGKSILVADASGDLTVIEVETGKEIYRLAGHEGLASQAVWSADGHQIASASADRSARVWSVNDRKTIRKLPHDDWVWCVAYAPNGKSIATGTGGPLIGPPLNQNYTQGNDNRIRLWDVQSGKLIAVFAGHSYNVRCLAFTPNGKYLVSGSFDKTVRLWDVATGKELSRFEGNTWVQCLDVAGDSRTIVTGGGTAVEQNKRTGDAQERLRVFRIDEGEPTVR